MIIDDLEVPLDDLRHRTGWDVKPVGACKGSACVPLPATAVSDGRVSARVLAARLGMPLVHDADHRLWALGPETLTGRTLTTAEAPDLVLPSIEGQKFELRSLRGQKVVLVAWASW